MSLESEEQLGGMLDLNCTIIMEYVMTTPTTCKIKTFLVYFTRKNPGLLVTNKSMLGAHK